MTIFDDFMAFVEPQIKRFKNLFSSYPSIDIQEGIDNVRIIVYADNVNLDERKENNLIITCTKFGSIEDKQIDGFVEKTRTTQLNVSFYIDPNKFNLDKAYGKYEDSSYIICIPKKNETNS